MEVKKVVNAFSTMWNPLRSLNKNEIERMMNSANHGADGRLQLVFSQIEEQLPIYQVCIQKRTAGVLGRDWTVEPLDQKNPVHVKQAEAVKLILEKSDTLNENSFTDAIKWLILSSFRGRAVVKPFVSEDGGIFFKRLQNWNVLFWNGTFYWNPSSEETPWLDQQAPLPPGMEPLPKDEICYLLNDTRIDIPGLMIYLRILVGEDAWSRATEKLGVPPIILTAPEGTPDTSLDAWNRRALQIFEGGSGTLPYGTDVKSMDSARGQDPFSEYIRHQMESISILATGGTLMTLGGSTGLGSDLARVQEESFNQLVNQDCKRISNAITNCVVKKIVRKILGEAEVCCRFTFTEDDVYSPDEYIDMAIKLHSMGIKLDPALLKEKTQIDFISTVQPDEWSPPVEKP